MPASPYPGPPYPDSLVLRGWPAASSSTSISRAAGANRTLTDADAAPACLRTFVSASWTMR